ncbi:hypothetical protein FHR75_001282 [Kineococcus radiotolerans]|uniref:Uncharacterized protein n=1 Tax=Kineococcus radiotolerans TaxID=131568 RepID=A0A7W4TKC2_KINRA|nr:hypothetical protein [Kineococcus radiotolerans]MBB2900494.1 hypothetical protein [Kineococcus radiotolerans]
MADRTGAVGRRVTVTLPPSAHQSTGETVQDKERTGAPCLGTPAERPPLTKKLNTTRMAQDDGAGLALTTLTPARPRAAVLVSVYTETGTHRRVVLSLAAAERARDRAVEVGRAVSLNLVMVTPASGPAQRVEALAEVTAVPA